VGGHDCEGLLLLASWRSASILAACRRLHRPGPLTIAWRRCIVRAAITTNDVPPA